MLGAAAILAWLRRKPGLCGAEPGGGVGREGDHRLHVCRGPPGMGERPHSPACTRHSAWLVALSGVLGISVFALYLHLHSAIRLSTSRPMVPGADKAPR